MLSQTRRFEGGREGQTDNFLLPFHSMVIYLNVGLREEVENCHPSSSLSPGVLFTVTAYHHMELILAFKNIFSYNITLQFKLTSTNAEQKKAVCCSNAGRTGCIF